MFFPACVERDVVQKWSVVQGIECDEVTVMAVCQKRGKKCQGQVQRDQCLRHTCCKAPKNVTEYTNTLSSAFSSTSTYVAGCKNEEASLPFAKGHASCHVPVMAWTEAGR
eukprot:1139420-Pelagomonas_calceolata.AAC.4